MRIGIRAKQVAGVTAVVALATGALFAWYFSLTAQSLLENARSNAQLISYAIYQRAFAVVAGTKETQPEMIAGALSDDEGLRNILQSVAYSEGIEYAVLVDRTGHIFAADDQTRIGEALDAKASLDDLVDNSGLIAQWRAIRTPGGMTLEVQKPLGIGSYELGSIRVGASTSLVRRELFSTKRFWAPLTTAGIVLGATVFVAFVLASVILRPIHVIRSGLAKLGRGELDAKVDFPADAELGDLSVSFQKITEKLAADRTELAGQRALESVVDQLEDAVALFGTNGALLFSNTAMDAALSASAPTGDGPAATVTSLWPAGHPYRVAVERALAGGEPYPPAPVNVPNSGDRLIIANVVPGAGGAPIGVLLVSRNLAYLSQVESTLNYSRKLAALSRLTAGIAHEIKNPLNAAMIHLELLRPTVKDKPDAEQSLGVITDQVRRLDEVVQGLLKFTRPEDLQLQPVDLAELFEHLRPVLEAEAGKHKVDLRLEIAAGLPPVDGDPHLLEQAFLNLALNAFQAMPTGGRLRVSAQEGRGRLVAIEIEDTGVGIPPENLSKIFDLYFTTKPKGSGIGLSLVFRTVQLHDGDIEVQSTPGRGTTFRVQLKQAATDVPGRGKLREVRS